MPFADGTAGLDAAVGGFAPQGTLAIILACLAFIADQYRRARAYRNSVLQTDVAELTKALNDADDRAQRAEADVSLTKERLGERITALETQMNELRVRLSQENAATHRHLELEMRQGWRLREWMAQNQWPLPPDIDPARPDVPVRLSPEDYMDTVTDETPPQE